MANFEAKTMILSLNDALGINIRTNNPAAVEIANRMISRYKRSEILSAIGNFADAVDENPELLTSNPIQGFNEWASLTYFPSQKSVDEQVADRIAELEAEKAKVAQERKNLGAFNPGSPEEMQASMGMSAKIISNMVANLCTSLIGDEAGLKALQDAINAKAGEYIEEHYGIIPRVQEAYKFNGKELKVPEGEVVHPQFKKMAWILENDFMPYLYGPSGTGKSVMAMQYAESVDKPLVMVNTPQYAWDITGSQDKDGNYVPSAFYEAWTKGWVIDIEEFDGIQPDIALILNTALANDCMNFGIAGNVKKNPETKIIVTGNTKGMGATVEYTGRAELDRATLDRFFFMDIDYDERIELAAAGGDKELVKFMHKFRKACGSEGITVVLTPRGLKKAKLANTTDEEFMSKDEFLYGGFCWQFSEDTAIRLRSGVQGCGDWSAAYDKFLEKHFNYIA